ncbi:MAG: GGDEF domain-containing protein [Pseudomonadota bacterium]
MFRLTRVYSIASLVGIVLVAIVLGVFYRTIAVRALIEHETQTNAALTQALANTLWPKYGAFVAQAGGVPVSELATRPESASLRKDVLQKVRGLRIVKIKIYNLDGLTVFSTEARQIGENKDGNPGFQRAKAGETMSDLVFRDRFSATEQVIENRNLLSSYIPLRQSPDAPVEGVFEVYSDVTSMVADIERTEYTVLAGVTTLLLLLYLFLLLIVRRADRIIQRHENEERKAQQEKIHYLAYHDALTGLANRALFKDRLEHAVQMAERNKTLLGIMFIDVDRFKVINDSLGHEGGEHRHRDLSGRDERRAASAEGRGCRHAPGQRNRPQPLRLLHGRAQCAGAGKSGIRDGAEKGASEPGVCPLLSAAGQYCHRRAKRGGGPVALAASHAGPGAA